ncbi:MAG TPA: YdeI/OmpD-associated family protein [Gemmatimonadales bacterium]|nr:YdeI/OmpD-associated family protein [Gemmatimonadales bacterium]
MTPAAGPASRPRFFATPARLRAWLEKHHAKEQELWIGFWKQDSGKAGIVYRQALDEALCFGWIDGIVRRLDQLSYMQRFTPRQARSYWSTVNIARAEELEREGRMAPAGLAAFAGRDAQKERRYSFENRPREFGPDLLRRFKADPKAWKFFEAQPPGWRRLAIWRVVSAKQDATRLRRLQQLIDASRKGVRLD